MIMVIVIMMVMIVTTVILFGNVWQRYVKFDASNTQQNPYISPICA